MYMNLKPNKHKRISMTSLVLIDASPKILGLSLNLAPTQIYFFAQVPQIILV